MSDRVFLLFIIVDCRSDLGEAGKRFIKFSYKILSTYDEDVVWFYSLKNAKLIESVRFLEQSIFSLSSICRKNPSTTQFQVIDFEEVIISSIGGISSYTDSANSVE
jgi:hypothetical protein